MNPWSVVKLASFMKTQTLSSILGLGLIFLFPQLNASAQLIFEHPHYLHALSDLRAARWMIEHRPGNWQKTVDEIEAVNRIDKAINEIKKAAIDDGMNLNDHPPVDEHPQHMGRLHVTVDFLKKAYADVNKEDGNIFANGLKNRALDHISESIRLTEKAIHDMSESIRLTEQAIHN